MNNKKPHDISKMNLEVRDVILLIKNMRLTYKSYHPKWNSDIKPDLFGKGNNGIGVRFHSYVHFYDSNNNEIVYRNNKDANSIKMPIIEEMPKELLDMEVTSIVGTYFRDYFNTSKSTGSTFHNGTVTIIKLNVNVKMFSEELKIKYNLETI